MFSLETTGETDDKREMIVQFPFYGRLKFF